MLDRETEIITVGLPDGQKVQLETLLSGGAEKVAGGILPDLGSIVPQIEGIVGILKSTLERVKPTKATIEFGIDIALESGQLTALIVKGAASGNLKLSLEWSHGKD